MKRRGGMKVRFAVQKEDERGRMGGKGGGGFTVSNNISYRVTTLGRWSYIDTN